MLSYRHAYHAGNFADVLKHAVLVHSLHHLTKKEKSLRIIDTHAGAGGYWLDSRQLLKNREIDQGMHRLWERDDLPPILEDYRQAVKTFNPEGTLTFYPGSPLLAQSLSRPQDRLFLHELHSTDHRLLTGMIDRDRRVRILDEDGMQGLLSLVPPPERRALVLIDPSYEIRKDYQDVVQKLIKAWQRFPTGTYALWYPVVSRQRIDDMERNLVRSGVKNIQLFELGVAPDSEEYGMTASGMIVINPPWTLWQAMATALPLLADWLSDGEGHFRQLQLVAE